MVRPQRVNGTLNWTAGGPKPTRQKWAGPWDDGQEHGDDPADLTEMENQHHLTFDTYAEGKLTLEEYLGRVFFYQKRQFTRDEGN